jgi:hypothetical protein
LTPPGSGPASVSNSSKTCRCPVPSYPPGSSPSQEYSTKPSVNGYLKNSHYSIELESAWTVSKAVCALCADSPISLAAGYSTDPRVASLLLERAPVCTLSRGFGSREVLSTSQGTLQSKDIACDITAFAILPVSLY